MTTTRAAGAARASCRFISRVFALFVFITGGLLSASAAHASVVQCGASMCSTEFTIDFNGNAGVGTGELLYDPVSGAISLNTSLSSTTGNVMMTGMGGLMWTMPDSSTITVGSLTGNADPILGFGLGASTGASGATFSISFNLPIALSGAIDATSSVSYSLTSLTSAGAQISGIGGAKVVRAFEVDTSVGGIGSLNKGVDVGDTFFFTGGPLTQNSSVYTASNTFTGDLAYDLMSVQVAFALSANSSVGISGFVSQTPVPVPAALWLFGSGLIGLVGVARRRAA